MDLNLKEIKALIALCRKSGVKVVKYGNIELTLGDAVERPHKAKKDSSPDTYETDMPSEEAMLFWSTQDVPELKTDENN